MGLFKSIKKGIKNIAKGITKIPIVGKVIKKAWQSKLGKLLVIAAAIYVTGGLAAGSFAPSAVGTQLGSWAGISAGSTAGTGATAAVSGTGGLTGATSLSSGLGLSTAATEAGAGALAGSAGSIGTIATGAGTAASTAGAAGATTAAANAGVGGGLLSSAKAVGTSALNYAQSNPIVAYGALQAAGKGIEAMNTPSEADSLRALQKVNSIGTDFYAGLTPLTGFQGGQGLISRARAGAAPQAQAQNPQPFLQQPTSQA